jgi:hypothetical protein
VANIPLLAGIYTNGTPDFRTAYPVNLVPVPMSTGISDAYLRPADGIVQQGTGPGIDRGGINWNGSLYRVMGTRLVRIDPTGIVQDLGDVGPGGLVTFDYSFDRLAIASGGRLYYLTGSSLAQVTDPDLGTVVDFCWVDGYFMTTHGKYIVVTELKLPFVVLPKKYASSEADPDPIVALVKVRNEVAAVNRNTIEFFDNVGGSGFPFQRIEGAQIMKGAVGTFACCAYQEQIAFLGSGRNEAPEVFLGLNAQANKISTQEVDEILATYTEAQLAGVKLEARNDRAHALLYMHLPDRTLVFDGNASKALGALVWFVLVSTLEGIAQYRARNFVWAYDRWCVGDPASTSFGHCVQTLSTHWGERVRWEISTPIAYNEGNGVIFHELELIALPGSVPFGENPLISTSYSLDGLTWSNDQTVRVGAFGDRQHRIAWRRQGSMRRFRIQRFRGDSSAHLPIARLEATLEPLAW